MRTIYLGVLVLGIALAGFAVYMAQNFIGQTQAQLEREQAIRQKMATLSKSMWSQSPSTTATPSPPRMCS